MQSYHLYLRSSVLPFFIAVSLISGCDKDDVREKEAEALSSFEGRLSFENARFAYENDSSLTIQFSHRFKGTNVELHVAFTNIAPTEGKTKLDYNTGHSPDFPTSSIAIIEGGDVFLESYELDSTATLESQLTITEIKDHKVTGEFNAYYKYRNYGHTSTVDWIPDKFSLTEGIFDARD